MYVLCYEFLSYFGLEKVKFMMSDSSTLCLTGISDRSHPADYQSLLCMLVWYNMLAALIPVLRIMGQESNTWGSVSSLNPSLHWI